MAKAKGIHAHKVFKLGKAPAKQDPNNLKFASLLRAAAPAIPDAYDFDATHSGIPTPMFANDVLGDCVGLVVLDSLKLWRQKGWKAANKPYKIKAFAEVEFLNSDQVRQAIYADVGLGVQLPQSAQEQISTGQPWEVANGPGSQPGSWGGHYIYVPGYTPQGPVCVTWGRKQQMTWAWLEKYGDEAYAIFDAKDSFKKTVIDKTKLNAFVARIPADC